MLAAVDLLSSNGAAVVWLTSPVPGAAAYESPKVQAFDPAPRHRRFDQLVQQLPDLRPGRWPSSIWRRGLPRSRREQDAVLRPDGVHFSHDASVEVCQRYLCDAILQAARQLQPGPPPDRTSADDGADRTPSRGRPYPAHGRRRARYCEDSSSPMRGSRPRRPVGACGWTPTTPSTPRRTATTSWSCGGGRAWSTTFVEAEPHEGALRRSLTRRG